jgi:hypothetical protein
MVAALSTGAAASYTAFHHEKNAYSNKCLDVPYNNWYYGAPIQQYTCNGGPNQNWTIWQWYDGAVQICGSATGNSVDFCIGRQYNYSNGDRAFLTYPGADESRRWWWDRTTSYTERFHSLLDGRCLDDPGWSTANGARIQVWDCTGGKNQLWTWL